MTGTSHLIFGVGTGIVSAIISPSVSFFHIPLIALASLLPDIDSSSSKIGRKMKLVGKLFGHRGFLHTPLFLSLFLLVSNEGVKWSFIIGILSHLFLDLMNRGGVMLFWPVSKKKFKLANLKCGAWFEGSIVILFLMLEVMGLVLFRRFIY